MSLFPKTVGECNPDCPSGKDIEGCEGPYQFGVGFARVFGARVIICGDFRIGEPTNEAHALSDIEGGLSAEED